MALDLTPQKAFIFRITHVANVPWILDHGVYCASSDVRDPDFRPIGDPDLIIKREGHPIPVPPRGTISDYVTFYFTPHSPMLLNIRTGFRGIEQVPMREIAILVSSLHTLREQGVPFLFTDRHAYLGAAQFSDDLAELSRIDWPILRARDFARSVDDLGKIERYQAEALIHRHVPVAALHGIACHGGDECGTITEEVKRRDLDLKVVAKPGWYF